MRAEVPPPEQEEENNSVCVLRGSNLSSAQTKEEKKKNEGLVEVIYRPAYASEPIAALLGSMSREGH